MRVVMETVQEVLQRLMHHRVMRDLVFECAELCCIRQLAIDQQIGDFKKTRLLCQLLDRITAIQQDAFIAIDERMTCALRHGAVDMKPGS